MFGCTYTELLKNEATIKPVSDSVEKERMLTGDSYLEHVRTILILLSEGKCELCNENAPFSDKEGVPFLLLEGVTAEDGIVLDNAVVLCPNCFCKIKELNSSEDIAILQKRAAAHSLVNIYKHLHS